MWSSPTRQTSFKKCVVLTPAGTSRKRGCCGSVEAIFGGIYRRTLPFFKKKKKKKKKPSNSLNVAFKTNRYNVKSCLVFVQKCENGLWVWRSGEGMDDSWSKSLCVCVCVCVFFLLSLLIVAALILTCSVEISRHDPWSATVRGHATKTRPFSHTRLEVVKCIFWGNKKPAAPVWAVMLAANMASQGLCKRYRSVNAKRGAGMQMC